MLMAHKLEDSSLVALFQYLKSAILQTTLPALRLACVYQ